ncbi:MAG: hypothetical protein ACE5ET_09100 [Gammaproteobacteria bacterium]
MVQLTRLDDVFQESIDNCNKEQLADCARLLAINLARYRHKFGRLPAPEVGKLLNSDNMDPRTAALFADGMLQCTLALAQAMGRKEVIDEIREIVEFNSDLPLDLDATAQTYQGNPHFDSDRVFYHSTLAGKDDGWYFTVRGGQIHGPFPDKAAAQQALDELVSEFQAKGETGDR